MSGYEERDIPVHVQGPVGNEGYHSPYIFTDFMPVEYTTQTSIDPALTISPHLHSLSHLDAYDYYLSSSPHASSYRDSSLSSPLSVTSESPSVNFNFLALSPVSQADSPLPDLNFKTLVNFNDVPSSPPLEGSPPSHSIVPLENRSPNFVTLDVADGQGPLDWREQDLARVADDSWFADSSLTDSLLLGNGTEHSIYPSLPSTVTQQVLPSGDGGVRRSTSQKHFSPSPYKRPSNLPAVDTSSPRSSHTGGPDRSLNRKYNRNQSSNLSANDAHGSPRPGVMHHAASFPYGNGGASGISRGVYCSDPALNVLKSYASEDALDAAPYHFNSSLGSPISPYVNPAVLGSPVSSDYSPSNMSSTTAGSFSVPSTPSQLLDPLRPTGDPAPFKQVVGSAAIESASNKRRVKEAKYECPVCQKRFTAPANQQRHRDAHFQANRIHCGCGKSYTTIADRSRHQKTSKCKFGPQNHVTNQVLS